MNEKSVVLQSKAAYGQWAKQWREHAKTHSKFPMHDLRKFENSGIGKAVLCVANGYSFEEQIRTIQKYQFNVDILCCDKTLGNLIERGIMPKYCLVCDANVDYEKYLKPYEHRLSGVTLFINVCANPKWTANGNWKEINFFVNADVINSHLEFSELSGCKNTIPAATNVSNAMVVFLTQSDNVMRKNFFGYDKIILIGFDYLWKANGHYYAFDKDGGGKAQYMKHSYLITASGEFAYTSGNLAFSKDWVEKYIRAFNLPVVQCGKDSLLNLGKACDLAEQMQYSHKPSDGDLVRAKIARMNVLNEELLGLNKQLHEISKDHWWAHARTV